MQFFLDLVSDGLSLSDAEESDVDVLFELFLDFLVFFWVFFLVFLSTDDDQSEPLDDDDEFEDHCCSNQKMVKVTVSSVEFH